MEINGTTSITVAGTNRNPIDPKTLRKIQNELTDKLSAVVDEHLASYGIENQQIHSCLVDDLSIDG